MSGIPSGLQPESPGIFESARAILQGLHEYLLVRCELAGIESRVVFRKLTKAALIFAVVLLCLVTGFLYLSLSLTYVLAETARWGWGWALFSVGAFLLILTASGLLWIRSVLQGKWFPVTFSELKKDSAWLSNKTTPNA